MGPLWLGGGGGVDCPKFYTDNRISWRGGGFHKHPPPLGHCLRDVIRPPENWETPPLLDIHKHAPPLDIVRVTSSALRKIEKHPSHHCCCPKKGPPLPKKLSCPKAGGAAAPPAPPRLIRLCLGLHTFLSMHVTMNAAHLKDKSGQIENTTSSSCWGTKYIFTKFLSF